MIWTARNIDYDKLTNCFGRVRQMQFTYSWSRIFGGKSSKGPLGKIVRDNISATLEFLNFPSTSLPPEARWLHTKQKLVSCNRNLTDTAPCRSPNVYKIKEGNESTVALKNIQNNALVMIITLKSEDKCVVFIYFGYYGSKTWERSPELMAGRYIC